MRLRTQVDELINAGKEEAAAQVLAELWRTESGPATAAFLVSRYQQLRSKVALEVCRIFVLRSFTIEPMTPLVCAAAYTRGLDVEVRVGEFNAYAQEILNETSSLYVFSPDIVILAVQTRDIAPELWRDFTDLSAAECESACERVLQSYRNWIEVFRTHSRAHLIIHNLEQPVHAVQGLIDSQSELSQVSAIQHLNQELGRLAREYRGVYILDYDGLVARHGRLQWHDERKWLTMRMPIAASHVPDLAREWLRFLHALMGRSAKALVFDLDNTIWGGVIGEDGMAGIHLGMEYPGAAYQDLQRAMLDLYRRGILLAVCSKNNPEDALEVFDHHPGMLLRRSHLAATRINWVDKAANLKEIAAELNIGIDALAFLDDNPVERAQVRSQLPEVTVLDLPADPMQYARFLRESAVFERLALSDEDRKRGEYYAAQRERTELEQTSSSPEDFYRSLQQVAEIAPLRQETLARVAQLTQKTNQFNLTTRRYTEEEVKEMASRPGWSVLTLTVRDRFADNGLVGVVITGDDGDTCLIDTFLLSCRVISRTVETALLSYVTEQARDRGCRRVQGLFLPTKKNGPCRKFYEAHGFLRVDEQDDGTLWEFDLAAGKTVPSPEWIRVIAPQHAAANQN